MGQAAACAPLLGPSCTSSPLLRAQGSAPLGRTGLHPGVGWGGLASCIKILFTDLVAPPSPGRSLVGPPEFYL